MDSVASIGVSTLNHTIPLAFAPPIPLLVFVSPPSHPQPRNMKPWLWLLISPIIATFFIFTAILSVWVPPREWFSSVMVMKTGYVLNHKIQTIKDFNSFCTHYGIDGTKSIP